jgi:photosystem II stability/assembly factor-like uncharacterized protein
MNGQTASISGSRAMCRLIGVFVVAAALSSCFACVDMEAFAAAPSVISSPGSVRWSGPIGIGGGGGIRAIAFSPSGKNIFVGHDVAGVSRSDSDGERWEFRNSGLETLFVHAIKFLSDDNIVIGTENGVYKSYDGGASWRRKDLGFESTFSYQGGCHVGTIAVDESDPKTVYAGIGDPDDLTEGKGLILRSIDGGEKWSRLEGTIREMRENTVVTAILAATIERQPVVFVGTDNGLFKSIDHGKTWQLVRGGLPSRAVNSIMHRPGNMMTFYALMAPELQGGGGQSGVWKSVDGGETWTEASAGLSREYHPDKGRMFSSNYYRMAFDAGDPNIIYLANLSHGGGVWRSQDGGVSWKAIFQNVNSGWDLENSAAVYSLAVDPNRNGVVYAGTATHLYRSVDYGSSWQQVMSTAGKNGYRNTGIENTAVFDLVSSPFNPENLYMTRADVGLLKSTDSGRSWEWIREKEFLDGRQPYRIVLDPADPEKVWIGQGHWVLPIGAVSTARVAAGGWQFMGKADGLPDAPVRAMALDAKSPLNARVLYVGYWGSGIYKTTDGGRNWQEINEGLPNQSRVADILIDAGNPDTVYACIVTSDVSRGGLYQSKNAGLKWRKLHDDSILASVWAVARDPLSPGTLYVAAQYDYNSRLPAQYVKGGIYKRVGSTWSEILTGYEVFDFGRTVHVMPDGGVLAGFYRQKAGIYYLPEGSSSWLDISTHLPQKPVLLIKGGDGPASFYVGTPASLYRGELLTPTSR